MGTGDELLSRTEALAFAFVYLGLARMDGFSSMARPLQHQLLWGSCAKEGVYVPVGLQKALSPFSHHCWVYKGYRPTPNICRVQGKKGLGPQASLLHHP